MARECLVCFELECLDGLDWNMQIVFAHCVIRFYSTYGGYIAIDLKPPSIRFSMPGAVYRSVYLSVFEHRNVACALE